MSDLSRGESPVLRWIAKTGDFFMLSTCWLLLCLPVVTIIPACIALYDTTVYCVHGEQDSAIKYLFKAFKQAFWKGLLLSAIWLPASYILTVGFNFLLQSGNENPTMMTLAWAYLFSLFLPLGILAWIIPLQSQFTGSLPELHKTAAIYTIRHLPTTFLVIFMTLVTAVLLYFLFPLALLVPAIIVTVQAHFIERIFAAYYPREQRTADADD